MLTIMTAQERRAAKQQLLADLEEGYSVPETRARASLPWHPATIYRLRQRLQADPVTALDDGRHGHPVKLRGEVRDWLVAFCQEAPHTPSHVVQAALQERFGLLVSISQLNRVRAALGLSSRTRGKKQAADSTEAPPPEPVWQEGAGSLLLLAAANETGLIERLEAALPLASPSCPARLAHSTRASRERLLLTLLFLNAVGLRRTWDLRFYTGAGLAVLSRRQRAYGYWHTERFLSQLARAGSDEALTDALAAWTAKLWPSEAPKPGQLPPAFYLDGHKKPVYTDHLIPRGLIGRTGKILGCRALLLLHDAKGHPLFATTHRGDLALPKGGSTFLTCYVRAAGGPPVARLIVDREGMAAEFLHALAAQGRAVVTILRSNQYQGVDSFTEVGPFVPLCRGRQGAVTREVAPARFALALPDHPGEILRLGVALIHDLRTQVPLAPSPAESAEQERWDADLEGERWLWWKPGWVATPTPAAPTEPKLIPIVTTAAAFDPVELVQVYTHRWPAQENSLRDFLLSLGLDTNHGYAKRPVENSEAAKDRAVLKRKLATAQRQAQTARERRAKAEERSRKLEKRLKRERAEVTRTLTERLQAWEQQGVWELIQRERREAFQQEAAAKLAPLQQRKRQAEDAICEAFAACERACQKERDLLRQLENLAANERAMYELDHAKDQVMTTFKLALVNLVIWTRDHYFPATYAQATWHRLAPFFQVPGRVVWGAGAVQVELRPFNDRQLKRDLEAVCAQVTAAQPHLPEGCLLRFRLSGTAAGIGSDQPSAV
jgi:transposase